MKTKSKKWQWVVIVVLGLALLATIGLSMSAAWFQDSDSAGTEAELGHAVTVRLQDVDSGEYGVKGWKELYDSSVTQAYPGDTLVGATRIEMGSTTPALIRAKITATVKDASGSEVTLSETKPTDMGEMTDEDYYTALIASKKTDEENYADKAAAWNAYLLGNMMKSLDLDTTKWTQKSGWMYYTTIFGNTTGKSESLESAEIADKTIKLFDKLILNPLLTNEVAQWTISLNLKVEAIQAANMDDATHPWHDDIQGITFSNSYDRGNDGTSSGGSGSGSSGGSSVQASPESYFTYDTTDGAITITGLSTTGATEANIVIPSEIGGVAVTAIGDWAFGDGSMDNPKTTLKSVVIPDSVKTIGMGAFANCTSLESVDLGEGLTSIGMVSFGLCSSLKSITIPQSVTTIGDAPFAYSGNLESIVVQSGNTAYKSDNNSLIEISSNMLLASCSNVIPDYVTKIGHSSFCCRTDITSITIPSSVTEIGESAFDGCSNLVTVTFAENSELTIIDNYVFNDCSSLTSITLPSGVTEIKSGAFNDCTSLASITIPSSMSTIGGSAFDNTALSVVYYTGTEDQWNAINISNGNSALKSANKIYNYTGA